MLASFISPMNLGFFQVFLWCDSSFPFSAEQYSIVWMHHSLFTHLPIAGPLGYFQVWAIIDKIAMDVCVQIFCVDIIFKSLGKTKEHEWQILQILRNVVVL